MYIYRIFDSKQLCQRQFILDNFTTDIFDI